MHGLAFEHDSTVQEYAEVFSVVLFCQKYSHHYLTTGTYIAS